MARLENVFAFDAEEMTEFLSSIGQVSLVAIHSSRERDVKGKWFGDDVDAAVTWAQNLNRDRYGIYFVANNLPDGWNCPAKNNKPANADIVSCRVVHVDVDPPHGMAPSGIAEFKAATINTFENLRLPPTVALDTGGGLAAYWFLDEPCANKDAITAINQQARTLFSADACHDVSRVMRVAGTLNHPSRVKEARGRKAAMSRIVMPFSGQVYTPEELRAFFPAAEHGEKAEAERKSVSLGNIELLTASDLGLATFNRLRRALEHPKGSDRSAYGQHAAHEGVREGLSDDQIAGLLLNPENPASGHFLDQSDPMRAVRRAIGRARGEDPDAQVVPQETREAVARLGTVKENMTVAEPEPATPDSDTKPFDWYSGLTPAMRMMVDTVNQYAPSPRPELALGSAIAAFATAMGRRYQTPSGLMSNIYLVGLSPSGSGKDLPINAPGQALINCGEQGMKLVGGSEVVSARGIMAAVEASPTLFLPIDEMGKLLQAIQDPRGILKDAIAVLLKLYSQSQSVFKGAMYANSKDRPTTIIHRPCLSFYGVSNPAAFWGKLTSESISDGLLPRFILMPDNTPDTPPPRRLRRAAYPDALLDALRACMGGAKAGNHVTFPMGDGSAMAPKPYTVEYADAAADDREYQMRLDQHEMKKTCDPEMVPFVNRLAENAMKLALVRAVSGNPEHPTLTVPDMEWGWALSLRSVENFIAGAQGNISENETEARVKKILAYIAAHPGGVRQAELGRRFQYIAGREREEILTDMEANGLITREKREPEGGKGRPIIAFRAAP